MTLQELLVSIPEAAKVERVPSVAQLAKEARPVVMDTLDTDTSVTVYNNGFVLYQRGQWVTVFPLHDCKDYMYKNSNEQSHIPYSEFRDQPWQVRVLMEGYDRMDHNCDRRREGRAVSIDIDSNQKGWIELSDMGLGDALRMIIEQEEKAEERETLRRNLSLLTEKQQKVLFLCVVEGKTRMEVAAEMGITHQAVTDCLKKSLRRLRKLYGVDESGFCNFFR